jgi:hypothetical protein
MTERVHIQFGVGGGAGWTGENKNVVIFGVKKQKAIPLEAWTGPEGSSRLRLPDLIIVGT